MFFYIERPQKDLSICLPKLLSYESNDKNLIFSLNKNKKYYGKKKFSVATQLLLLSYIIKISKKISFLKNYFCVQDF